MKKLFALMLMSLIVISCSKKMEIGDICIGDNYDETYSKLMGCVGVEVKKPGNNEIKAKGNIKLFRVTFDEVTCEFENDEIYTITARRKFSSLPKAFMDELIRNLVVFSGKPSIVPEQILKSDYEMVLFGSPSQNKNGYTSSLALKSETDELYLLIRLCDKN